MSNRNTEYYLRNRVEILKGCKEHYRLNRDMMCERDKVYYHKNREEICRKRRERNHLNGVAKQPTPSAKEILSALREGIELLSCVDCGLSFSGRYWIADFHYEIQKSCKKGIYSCITSVGRLFSELNRGIFLCPNCHRIRHRKNMLQGSQAVKTQVS